MHSKHKTDIACGVFFFVLGGLIVLNALTIPTGLATGFGAESIPSFCGYALMLLSVGLILEGAMKMKHAAAQGQVPEKAEKPTKEDRFKQLHVLLAIGMVALYVILLKELGYLIVTPLFLFGLISMVAPKSKRNLVRIAIISVITVAIIYVIFKYGFAVQLPDGIFK